jgi:hypothetical protein
VDKRAKQVAADDWLGRGRQGEKCSELARLENQFSLLVWDYDNKPGD